MTKEKLSQHKKHVIYLESRTETKFRELGFSKKASINLKENCKETARKLRSFIKKNKK